MNIIQYIPEEVWIPIPHIAVPGVYDIYLISNYGKVYSKTISRCMKETIMNNGYHTVILVTEYGPKVQLVHRLVMLSFSYIIGCENLDVNHLDGNKSHNYIWNLEWATRVENMKHAYDYGLCQLGENSNNGKLTDDQAKLICYNLSIGTPINTIIDIIENTSHNCNNLKAVIYAILERQAWTHISKDYEFKKYISSSYNIDQVKYICEKLQDKTKIKDIMTGLGIDINSLDEKEFLKYYNAISNIKRRKTHTEISSGYDF